MYEKLELICLMYEKLELICLIVLVEDQFKDLFTLYDRVGNKREVGEPYSDSSIEGNARLFLLQ